MGGSDGEVEKLQQQILKNERELRSIELALFKPQSDLIALRKREMDLRSENITLRRQINSIKNRGS